MRSQQVSRQGLATRGVRISSVQSNWISFKVEDAVDRH
jgi:hypothetical protein